MIRDRTFRRERHICRLGITLSYRVLRSKIGWKGNLEDSNYSRLQADVLSLIETHTKWTSKDCLNLVSAHNVLSPSARSVLSSGLADKIMAGRIGRRDHAGSTFIDQIDSICIAVAQRLFGARFVEHRPLSGAISNGIAICAITLPGENIITWPKKYGGHFTFHEEGYPYFRKLKVYDVPCTEEDDVGVVDFDALEELVDNARPSTVILGSSIALFPFPVRRIARLASRAGANVMYDGAHVMGLVAGDAFQDPLGEGATILTGSTQKTIPGPVGGLILCNEKTVADSVQITADRLIANYQNNRVASLTIALIELLAFGKSLAGETVKNAQYLARALSKQGLAVLSKKHGFTESHQLLVDMSEIKGRATNAVRKLESANILSTSIPIPKDHPHHLEEPSGLRLGTNEVTRFGMGSDEMTIIANLISRALIDKEEAGSIRREVSSLKKAFPDLKYVLEPQHIAKAMV